VQVLDSRVDGDVYCRKILLRRQDDGRVVQFGIVRLRLDYLEAEVRSEIESCAVPLGRSLIEHGVLRDVQLCGLWRVRCGDELSSHFGAERGIVTYGRTAVIRCNRELAIELLEIVSPEQ
jgi:chorismate-pyruvate lyase